MEMGFSKTAKRLMTPTASGGVVGELLAPPLYRLAPVLLPDTMQIFVCLDTERRWHDCDRHLR
jgi:hypothetical protein